MKPSTRNTKRALLLSAAATAACLAFCGATSAAPKTSSAKDPASIFVADKGKFEVRQDGQLVGHEEFEISSSAKGWIARGTDEIKPSAGSSARITGNLTLQPDGAPLTYEWTSQADKKNGANISFANGVAKITLQMEGARPFEQTLTFNTPLIAILDNNLYYQYAVLARLYDWSKRGQQTFPVLVPQELTPGTITVESTGSVTADGKSFDGLRVTTADLEVILYLDTNHRMVRLEVPAAKVIVTRQ
ncbi:MAG TPA: hypothetical protein VGI16_11185 [Candidatus Acidoferrum sp.]|jgi:hypothetical protein